MFRRRRRHYREHRFYKIIAVVSCLFGLYIGAVGIVHLAARHFLTELQAALQDKNIILTYGTIHVSVVPEARIAVDFATLESPHFHLRARQIERRLGAQIHLEGLTLRTLIGQGDLYTSWSHAVVQEREAHIHLTLDHMEHIFFLGAVQVHVPGPERFSGKIQIFHNKARLTEFDLVFDSLTAQGHGALDLFFNRTVNGALELELMGLEAFSRSWPHKIELRGIPLRAPGGTLIQKSLRNLIDNLALAPESQKPLRLLLEVRENIPYVNQKPLWTLWDPQL